MSGVKPDPHLKYSQVHHPRLRVLRVSNNAVHLPRLSQTAIGAKPRLFHEEYGMAVKGGVSGAFASSSTSTVTPSSNSGRVTAVILATGGATHSSIGIFRPVSSTQ